MAIVTPEPGDILLSGVNDVVKSADVIVWLGCIDIFGDDVSVAIKVGVVDEGPTVIVGEGLGTRVDVTVQVVDGRVVDIVVA